MLRLQIFDSALYLVTTWVTHLMIKPQIIDIPNVWTKVEKVNIKKVAEKYKV